MFTAIRSPLASPAATSMRHSLSNAAYPFPVVVQTSSALMTRSPTPIAATGAFRRPLVTTQRPTHGTPLSRIMSREGSTSSMPATPGLTRIGSNGADVSMTRQASKSTHVPQNTPLGIEQFMRRKEFAFARLPPAARPSLSSIQEQQSIRSNRPLKSILKNVSTPNYAEDVASTTRRTPTFKLDSEVIGTTSWEISVEDTMSEIVWRSCKERVATPGVELKLRSSWL